MASRAVLLLLLGAVACSAQPMTRPAMGLARPVGAPAARTLTDKVNPNSPLKALLDNDLTLFARIANASGLVPALNASVTKATIFAPTNAAITKAAAAFGVTPEQLLSNHLLVDRLAGYHIHPNGAVRSSALRDGAAIPTARGGDLKAAVSSSGVTFTGAQNSAKVTKADIAGGASVIHVIDNVLLPNDVFPDLKSALTFKKVTKPIADVVLADAVLSKRGADPKTAITLFVPSDAAAAAVFATPAGKAIAGNPEQLRALIEYHSVPGAIILPNGVKGDSATLQTALKGQSVTIRKVKTTSPTGKVTGRVTVTGSAPGAKPATVGKFNIIAGNSMINIIDGVLLPAKL